MIATLAEKNTLPGFSGGAGSISYKKSNKICCELGLLASEFEGDSEVV